MNLDITHPIWKRGHRLINLSRCKRRKNASKIPRVFVVTGVIHSPPQRLSDSTGENHVKRKKRSLCHKMCSSQHKSRGSWHVQQQQRLRLKKEKLCSDTNVIVGFIMEPRIAQDSDKSLTGLEL